MINNILKEEQTLGTSFKDIQDDRSRVAEEFDEMSIPDTAGSSTSTPTPPQEYVTKLQQAELMIERLRNENLNQHIEV